jgi:DNA-directed RNA polymerase specialized sigma24 family protein
LTLPPPAPDDEPSDLDCLTRVRAGEAAAFEPLYRRYHRDAIAIAVNLAGHDRADDLAAEAFARVLRALLGG